MKIDNIQASKQKSNLTESLPLASLFRNVTLQVQSMRIIGCNYEVSQALSSDPLPLANIKIGICHESEPQKNKNHFQFKVFSQFQEKDQ